MATYETTWSFGEPKIQTSSGSTIGTVDQIWSYGERVLYHEYVAAAGGAILKYWNGSAWVAANLDYYDSTWQDTILSYYDSTWQDTDTAGV